MNKAILSTLVLFFLGCDSEPVSPEEVYMAYIERPAEGMSFDDELGFWSEDKLV